MHGFITIISKKKVDFSAQICWKKRFDFQSKTTLREICYKHYKVEQYTSEKFLSEKMWIDNDDFLCVTEGVILNIDELCTEYNTNNKSDLLKKMYERKSIFFNDFDGSFAGVFYDKHKDTWFAFGNHTSTKRLFYFQNNDYYLFSTDLYTLTQALKSLQIDFSIDQQAAYLLLNTGFIPENLTLVSSVNKLRAGEYIQTNKNDGLSQNYYFHLQNIRECKESKIDIIHNLDYKFKESVKKNFNLCKKYNYENISTLSGGLDSRMTSIIGYKLGFKNQSLFNFSEPGYADCKIATEIAQHYKLPILTYELSPKLLLSIENVIAVNDGIGSYIGCSHVFSILQNIPKNAGCIHTGIMGDTIMGSASNKDENKTKKRIFNSNIVFPLAKEYIKNTISEYNNLELCIIYNNIFTNESNGFLYFDLVGNTCSPFLNKEFLSYAYSIPQKYKQNRNLYIDWINTVHPDIGNFTWETIAGKPTNNDFLRFYYKYKRAIIKRLPIKTIWKNSMNPEQIWYNQNLAIKNGITNYFNQNIERIENSTLRNNTISLFEKGNINEKTNCITLVGAIKLLF